jgi:hypothetical protein
MRPVRALLTLGGRLRRAAFRTTNFGVIVGSVLESWASLNSEGANAKSQSESQYGIRRDLHASQLRQRELPLIGSNDQ